MANIKTKTTVTPKAQTGEKVYFQDALDTYFNEKVSSVKDGQRLIFVPFNAINTTEPYMTIHGRPTSIIDFNRITLMPSGQYKNLINKDRAEEDKIKMRMFVIPELEEYSVYDVLYELAEEYDAKTTTDERKAEILNALSGINSKPTYMLQNTAPLMFGFCIPLWEGADEKSPEYRAEIKSFATEEKFDDVSPYYFELKKDTIKNLAQTIGAYIFDKEDADGNQIYNNEEEIVFYNKENPAKSRGILFQRAYDGTNKTKNSFTSKIIDVNATQLKDIAERYIEQDVFENPNVTNTLIHFYNATLERQFETVVHLGIEHLLKGTKLEEKFNTFLANTGGKKSSAKEDVDNVGVDEIPNVADDDDDVNEGFE